MQEQIKMMRDENSRLTSERDAALANLRESEENVFDLQQAIEVRTYIVCIKFHYVHTLVMVCM